MTVTLASPYCIGNTPLFLKDTPPADAHGRVASKPPYDLEFHLHQGDFFGVVAHALGIAIDDYAQRHDIQSVRYELLLRKLQRDLASLHLTHDIVPKSARISGES